MFPLATELHFETISSISAICYAASQVFVSALMIDFQYGDFLSFFLKHARMDL